MTVTTVEAGVLADLFQLLADGAPVRHVRDEMAHRAAEWRTALADVEEMGEDVAVIELAGSVVPSMHFAGYEADGRLAWQTIDRVLHRDGGVALQYTDPLNGRAVYVNRRSPTSPAVIRR